MSKSLFIAEKPSVAREFAKALDQSFENHEGYMESEYSVVTWCLGHLVTMSYPEAYDPKYKKWSLDTLPFIPKEFKYEVIASSKKQYKTVASQLKRRDVDIIYVCTDSGREGEYIYRLVDRMAKVGNKEKKRVWIDSQTKEEILRGIEDAKDLCAYDNLASSAYLRAKEDYLMGINFSRLLTLKYGNTIASLLGQRYVSVSAGRVMTCVLGMVVRREREIRDFVKTPFYRVCASFELPGENTDAAQKTEGEWRASKGSKYFDSPKLYKENGFKERKDAEELISFLKSQGNKRAVIEKIEKKKEKKNPPLLYNLAELQNDCSRMLKLSPDETLKVVQELYEKKLVTYPRTDARVLSSAVAKEIRENISGLSDIKVLQDTVQHILDTGSYMNIAKTRYVNDKMITDHYAIIPTGQGTGAMKSLKPDTLKVYEMIVRRFLAIFLESAVYRKINITFKVGTERFYAGFKALDKPGYLKVMRYSFERPKPDGISPDLAAALDGLKKGMELDIAGFEMKEGETSPSKRYSSGSMILAMENAGQLIEDEELRAQIKGSGIGTSATRADILKKLVNNKYLSLNKKTQIITPTLLGELIYEAAFASVRPLLNPELTASWEKGLSMVAAGEIGEDEYMEKLEGFIRRRSDAVKKAQNQDYIRVSYSKISAFYKPVRKYAKRK